ncbi:MAG: hypothetical protein JWR16_3638 [Nevskia sp.]|nr:hypothetical protein [Nevskia sp.]
MTSTNPVDAVAEPVHGLIVDANPVRLWGMSSTERLHRSLRLVGVKAVETESDHRAAAARLPPQCRVVIVSDDWVFDMALIRDLAARRDGVVLIDAVDGMAVAANVAAAQVDAARAALAGSKTALPDAARLTPEQLSGAYNHQLRKRQTPYLLRLTPASLPAIEALMFGASYKGVTDVVTKYVWPRPARYVTRVCAELKVTPNQVTLLSLVLTLWSFWLFWNGHYALGLASGWLMTFLDTVDGKLARVTLTYSKFGDIFDHGIDLIHPPFWWWAWVVGLPAYGTPLSADDAEWILAVILVGYVLQRVLEGAFINLFDMHMHVWRRFDSQFRLWTARRNPNLLILTPAVALGRPDLGIELVALWTALSLAVHALQIVQGLFARRHGPLESWLRQ